MFTLKKIKKNILTVLCLVFLIIPVLKVNAYDFNQDSGLENTADKSGYSAGLYDASLTPKGTIIAIITNVISILLSLMGIAFLLLMIYGGYLWMTAQGSEAQVKKAKEIILDSIVGLAIIFIAYALSYLIISIFSKNRIK